MDKLKKNTMKIVSLFICFVLVFCVGGCGSKQSKDDSTTGEILDEENEETLEEDVTRDITFNGDVVISQGLILILNNDGTVWGKGNNVLGQLGNGRRDEQDEWTQIVDLENVTGIYAGIKYGNGQEGTPDGHCYALNGDKELFRWGGNIFTPEIVDVIPDIEEVNKYGNSAMTVKTKENQRYFMYNYSTGEVWDDMFIPYKSDAEVDIISGNAILQDGNLTFFHMPLFQDLSPQNYITISDKTLDDWINEYPEEVVNIESVESVSGNFFVSSDVGNVCEMQEDGTIRDCGGTGYKKYVRAANLEVTLFGDGTLCTRGDNRYGQLGDGTEEDLESTFYEVTEAKFKDFVTDGYFVAAIDYDNNLWAWGKGYGDPEIVVSYEEFVSATFDEEE